MGPRLGFFFRGQVRDPAFHWPQFAHPPPDLRISGSAGRKSSGGSIGWTIGSEFITGWISSAADRTNASSAPKTKVQLVPQPVVGVADYLRGMHPLVWVTEEGPSRGVAGLASGRAQ